MTDWIEKKEGQCVKINFAQQVELNRTILHEKITTTLFLYKKKKLASQAY